MTTTVVPAATTARTQPIATTTTTTQNNPSVGTYGHYDKAQADYLAHDFFQVRLAETSILIEDVWYEERIVEFLEYGGVVDAILPASFDYPSLNRTILHWAAFFKKQDVCALLVKAGASIEAKDDTGKTPKDLAIESGAAKSHPELVELLTSDDGDYDSQPCESSQEN